MGDPRRLRNKFERPKKLWDVDRIKHDKTLKVEYGLKNMSELWRSTAELKKYRREARRLLSLTEEERRSDAEKILQKLARLGVMKKGSVIDDVLSLEVKVILDRRLQTLVMRKGLARTMRQARQLITHGFIGIGERSITRPGYMVNLEEDAEIAYTKPIDITVRPEEKAEEEAKPEEAKEPEPNEEKPAAEPKPKEAKEPESKEKKPAAEPKPKEAKELESKEKKPAAEPKQEKAA